MIEIIIIKGLGLMSRFMRILPRNKTSLISIKAWFLRYVLRYRYKTIKSNLERIRPSLQPQQIRKITKEYYQNLIRYILEIIECISLDPEKIKARIDITNEEKWKNINKNGTSIIMASHYGNWEINVTSLPLFVTHKIIAFYKPISNKYLEKVMLKLRSKHGLFLYPIEQTVRVMLENKDQKVWYIFVGDQGPLNMNGVYWNEFLGVETPWLMGAEKLAKKYNYPVYYLHQIPVNDPYFYRLDLSMITENPLEEANGQITEKYTKFLSAEIKKDASYWLWSHKRWKRANRK